MLVAFLEQNKGLLAVLTRWLELEVVAAEKREQQNKVLKTLSLKAQARLRATCMITFLMMKRESGRQCCF